MSRPPTIFAETPKQARRMMAELYSEAYLNGKITGIDSEFVPITHEPVLVSFSWGRGIRRVVRAELFKEFFGDWAVDPQTKLAYQNYKEDVETFEMLGFSASDLAASFYIDTMVAGVLRDETLIHHGLKAQQLHWLKWPRREYKQTFCYVPPGKKMPIVMTPRQVMDDLPPDALLGAVLKWGSAKGGHKTGPMTREQWIQAMIDYAGDDAEGTAILGVDHRRYLRKTGYWDKYVNVDLPFTLTLMQCEASGAFIDQPTLERILRKQDVRIMRAEHCFRTAAGNPSLNLRSPVQMRKLLIDEWGWPSHPDNVSEKTGESSMDKEVLTWWLTKHKLELAEVKLAFNNATTMKGTFLLGILKGTSEDGRLRSDLNQIGGKTCLPAGELVLTDRGYLPVEEVAVGDQVLTHERRARRVTKVIDNGVAQCWRVTLANGLKLVTTGNHPYLTNGGWIEASKLKLQIHYVTTHSHKAEEWRLVEDWPAFEVSSFGRVRNRFTEHVLALQKKDKFGHLKVTLVRNKAKTRGPDRKDFMVHRLVQEAFGVGERKPEVRHWDGIAWNNVAENLAWATRRENAADMKAHGSGGNNWIYTQEMVDVIRSTLHVRGGRAHKSSDLALAKQLGMTRENVSAIRLGKSWMLGARREKTTSFAMSPVISVEKLDRRQTYGLTVEQDHSHVTGGIVTHNSGRISSRKFKVMVEKTQTYKNGKVKTWVKEENAGANLQNIPARKEKDPDGIRGAFRAARVGETTAFGKKATENHKLLVCVVPETRILKADMTWAPAGSIKVGDKLVGFDEDLAVKTKLNSFGNPYKVRAGQGAKLRESIVQSVRLLKKDCFRVVTDRGTVTSSDEHMWVAKKRSSRYSNLREWIRTDDLEPGDEITSLCSPWDVDTSYSGGYLAGIFDGEGWVHRGSVCFGQNIGPTLDTVKTLLTHCGFDYVERPSDKKRPKMRQLELRGNRAAMRFLGSIRPKRLLNTYMKDRWQGTSTWDNGMSVARVLKVERVHDAAGGHSRDVVAIKTSTKTFIAEGMLSHNCDYSGFHLVLVANFVADMAADKSVWAMNGSWSQRAGDSAMVDVMKKYGTPSAVHVYTTIQMFKHVKPHYCDSSSPSCMVVDKKTRKITGEWKKLHGPNKSYSLKEFTMADWELVKPIFPDQYTYSKNTNFSLIFLGSPWTLAYNTGRDASDDSVIEECKRHYDDWYGLYPEIKTYQQNMIDHAYEHGWVPTIGGRRGHLQKMLEGYDKQGRYIRDDEKRKQRVKHAERVATNTPAQGGEADIVKDALNRIRKNLKLIELFCAPLFPVHDEVVCEAPESTAEEALPIQIAVMKEPYKELLTVPLAVEGAIGDNWLSAKP